MTLNEILIDFVPDEICTVKVNYIIDSIQFKFICIVHFTIQNRCNAALQEIRFLQYILLVAYQ